MCVEFEQDKSGINSLGGFSYQIKVFVYYLSMLKKGMQLEFESYDDVSFKKINLAVLDDESDDFRSILCSDEEIKCIQVKRTDISKERAIKTFLNWILVEDSGLTVSKYILFTDSVYNNADLISEINCEDLFKKVEGNKQGKKSTIWKVQQKYKDNAEDFKKIYDSIKEKYSFIEIDNLDKEIESAYSELFRKEGLDNELVYFQRVKALLVKITSNIMKKIDDGSSYIITHNEFMRLIEEISINISDANPVLDYMSFKKSFTLDLNDARIANLREFQQLTHCELNSFLTQNYLTYASYYSHFRMTNSELNRTSIIENIEETAFENYSIQKFDLIRNKNDTPYNRLKATEDRENSYTGNIQLKSGVIIYLTKDNIGERQISWKDE